MLSVEILGSETENLRDQFVTVNNISNDLATIPRGRRVAVVPSHNDMILVNENEFDYTKNPPALLQTTVVEASIADVTDKITGIIMGTVALISAVEDCACSFLYVKRLRTADL